ncbi:hypothetical protein LshimejAT787_0409510 [Lyophyllum shimeji]|uniref:Uncharacterized protein n=1 Tax=Lyophyllum shimeji TaxID=47721 RepID=A0A9P3UNI7_LYOSH|nr:hypothetical protein LshimejAT787_0409510 [Lyophyllum shimeji]
MYNGESWLDPTSTLSTWQIYNDEGPAPRAFYNCDESVEIIAGPAAGLLATTSCISSPRTSPLARRPTGFPPPSLSAYTTHASTPTSPQLPLQTASRTTESPHAAPPSQRHLATSPHPPPPPSPRRISITRPQDTTSFSPNITSLPPIMNIEWEYRDQRNSLGAGISDVGLPILDSATSSPVGPPQKLLTLSPEGLVTVKFADVPMKGGSYKAVLTYKNNIQDGAT